MRRPIASAALSLLALALAGCAQTDADGDFAACTVTKLSEVAIINRGPYVTAVGQIDGKPATMLIDTGAQTSAVTGGAVTALHLLADPRHGTELVGVGGSAVAENDALVDDLSLGGVASRASHVAVVRNFTNFGDPPLQGIIGADVLARNDIAFDFAAGRLAFYRVRGCSGRFLRWTGPYAAIPARIEESDRLTVPVTINGHAFRAMVDSGSNVSILGMDAARRLGVPDSAMPGAKSRAGHGAAGVIFHVANHRFATLQVGPETLHDVNLPIVDRTLPEADMLLGLDFLRARRVWFSYRTAQFFVSPP